MKSVKIYGAGSIGNHMANASRALGWAVDLCDIDLKALERTKNEIYPQRYKTWDAEINLYETKNLPKGKIYDLVIIGTPPESHLPLALESIRDGAKALLLEKPLCAPDLKQMNEFYEAVQKAHVPAFIGYDHVVGKACEAFTAAVVRGGFGKVQAIDVEFREFWGGIFAAHPWLEGPSDTYLGYWRRGGGALGEHSHALNMWQHMARSAGAGRVTEVRALLEYVKDGKAEYDAMATLHLKTEKGITGRVLQDVVTSPTKKWGRVQTEKYAFEWLAHMKPGVDGFQRTDYKNPWELQEFLKTRPDDFIAELRHIDQHLTAPAQSSISIERGLDTMLVIAAAHLAAQEVCTVCIDYSQGYSEKALKVRR